MRLKPVDFYKLEVFIDLFLDKKSLSLMPGSFKVGDLPVEKKECLGLLRSFPELQGNQFKNDAVLSRYLLANIQRIINSLEAPSQRLELTALVERKKRAAEAVKTTEGQPSGQPATAEQTLVATSRPNVPPVIPIIPIINRPVARQPQIIIIKQAAETPGEKTQVSEVKPAETAIATENPPVETEPAASTSPAGRLSTPETSVPGQNIGSQMADLSSFPVPNIPLAVEEPVISPTSPVAVSPESTQAPSSTPEAKSQPAASGLLPQTSTPHLQMGGGNIVKFPSAFRRLGGGVSRGLAGGLKTIRPPLSRVANQGLRMANQGLGAMGNITKPGRRGGAGGPKAPGFSSGKKTALIFTALFLLIIITGFTGGFNVTTPTGQAAPLPTTPVQTNLSSCKFTRDGLATPIASSRLISLFAEAAAKTGVPAAALATLAMHESSVFTSTAKDNHDAFGNSNITAATGCTHFGLTGIGASKTGALGLMQVQPPKKIHDVIAAATAGMKDAIPAFDSVGAYSADGVERGAKFVGKTADILTLQDFCDVRTSIYLGAGVLISKNGGKPPTTDGEVNKSVCAYYGSCVYDKEGVVYNYGNEAQQDFENCKPASGPSIIAVTSCPIQNGKITCGSSRGAPGIPACHCTPSYSPSCPAESRRGKAIDIQGPNGSKDGDPVYIPLINGRVLKWYFRGDFDDAEGATLRVFQSEPTSDGVWTIHFVHSKRKDPTNYDPAIPIFSKGQEITDLTQPVAYIDKSSSVEGSVPIHTHVSIGLIGDNWYDGDLQYTNKGWKYADAELKMCQ